MIRRPRPAALLAVCLLLGGTLAAQLPIPGNGSSTIEEQVALRSASAALRNGKWDEVIRECRKALESNPDSVMAHLFAGIAQRRQAYLTADPATRDRQLAEAEQSFTEALLIDRFEARAVYQLADLQTERARMELDPDERLRKLDQAKETWQRLILLAPRTREAHLTYGTICLEQAQQRQAAGAGNKDLLALAEDGITHLKIALQTDSRSVPSLDALQRLHALRARLLGPEAGVKDQTEADQYAKRLQVIMQSPPLRP